MSNTSRKSTPNSQSGQYFFILCLCTVTLIFLPEMADPFNTIKLIVLILSSSWFLGHVISTFTVNRFRLSYSETRVVLILLFFITSLAVSTFFTDQKLIGLIGDTQRRNGLLSYVALSIILLYGYQKINFGNSATIFNLVCLCALILSLYGFIQISGSDFVEWDNPYNNMISTLGNPNFASSLLAIFVVILFYGMFVKELSKLYKMVSIFVITLSLYDIVLSKSIQGILVVVISTMFYVVLYFHRNKIKFNNVISLLSLLTAILAILGMLKKGPLSGLLYKDSVSVRGYYWRAGWEMFKDNLLTGVGVDRYVAYFKEYREAGYPLKYGFEIGSSNAHNIFIQLFATSGLFVGTAYLCIVSYVFINGIKLVYNTTGQNQKISLALLSAWIGFNAQSFISIDNLGVSVWGWLLGGAILGLAKVTPVQPSARETTKVLMRNNKVVQTNLLQQVLSIAVLIPSFIVSLGLYRSETDLYTLRAIIASNSVDYKNYAIKFANDVLNNPFSDPNYRYEAAMSLIQVGEVNQGSQVFADLMAQDPNNLRYLSIVARNEENLGNLALAIDARLKISKFDPYNVENLLKLIELYLDTEASVQANFTAKKILSFTTDSATVEKVNNLLEKS